ncbi:hypothetical protein LRD18_11130 [Halorhodospira halochloris]|uniref:hypothetical protein n=1 Tax=Halorhodospira halochloris TaxID=1052 RepID=UPI001EE98824|nr:hypothetical protein [Halorhodospira halochloris]MCG5531401.1 hypothetical protein [Halorhodospira halochloris]
MNDRDYFAAHTYVSWQDAENVLRNAGNRKPSVDDVIAARARMRYAEADAMLALRAESSEGEDSLSDNSSG